MIEQDPRMPLVSIGLPVFNGEKDLARALVSLSRQDYPNIELVLSDNGSTDRTLEIASAHAHLFERFRIHREPRNKGALANFRKVLELAEGEFFVFCGHDDFWEPDFVSASVAVLEKEPDSILCNPGIRFVDPTGTPISADYDAINATRIDFDSIAERVAAFLKLSGWYMTGSVSRTKALKRALFMPGRDYEQFGSDVNLDLELLLQGKFAKADKTLFYYTQNKPTPEARHQSTQVEYSPIVLPYAGLSLRLIRSIMESSSLADRQMVQSVGAAIHVFATDKIWDYRFASGASPSYCDQKWLKEEREIFLGTVPFSPARLLEAPGAPPREANRPKVAIFEFNPHHDHVIPSLIRLLNDLGFHADVFIPQAAIENDVFAEFDGLEFSLHAIDHPAFEYWVKAFRFIEYEFLVMNSIEPDAVLQKIKDWPGRKICILHNPELVFQNEAYRKFLEPDTHRGIVLAANVAAATLRDKDAWIAPFVQTKAAEESPADGKTRFVVQGVVEDRRNYASLLDAVRRLSEDASPPDFEVVLLGKVFVPFGEELRQEISRSPLLSRRIRFVEDATTYRKFYHQTRQADFILPLIDTTSPAYANYTSRKITSSIMTAFAFRIPPVLHSDLQKAFRIPGFGYRDGGLHEAMRLAIGSSQEERSEIRREIDRARGAWLEQSERNFRTILESWGMRHENSTHAAKPPSTAKPENTRYDEQYFRWQSPIGAFGGKANLVKFNEFIADAGTVADFGCGGGYLLENLPARRKIGIEINPVARDRARSIGIETYATPEEIPDSSIDLMVSNHALEHVHDPLSTLRVLLGKLKHDGTAVFVVPHDSVAIAFDPNDVNQHLFTWNPSTLGNLFQLAGFRILRSEAFQHMWMPDYETVWNQVGESEFHRLCKELAVRSGNYQIRIVAKRP